MLTRVRGNRYTQRWTDGRERRAREMLADGANYDDIGDELGVSAEYVQEQIEGGRDANPQSQQGRQRADAAALAEREARLAARFARDDEGRARGDLTGEHFGDPPPGYSALDRRRRQQNSL
jgi:hypothetical protein